MPPPAPPASAAAPVRPVSRAVLAVLLAAVFMSLLDMFVVNVALPAVGRHFAGAGPARLSWVLNAYAIVFAALLVPAGRWADRAGRKRVFLLGLGLFTGASALCAAAPSLGFLIGARALQAAGSALISPAAMGLLLPEFRPERRSVAIALFAAVGGVAAALGAPVGGLLAQVSWHWVFLVNLPIGAAALLAGTRLLREIRETDPAASPDLLGAALLAGAVGDLVLLIMQGPAWGWTSRTAVAHAAAVIALGAGFLLRSGRHRSPVVDLGMLRGAFAAANAAGLLFAAAFGSLILANVLYLTGVWHSAAWQLGLQLTPGPVCAAAMALPAGRLCRRWSPRAVALAGAGCFSLGIAWWMFRLGPTPDYASRFLPGSLLTGTGIGLSLPSVTTAAMAALPPARFSTGSAILNMSRQIGSALGVAVLVALVGRPDPTHTEAAFHTAYAVTGLAALGSGLVALAF